MKRAAIVLALLVGAPLYAGSYRVIELPGLAAQGETPSPTAAYALSNPAAEDSAAIFVAGVAGDRAVRWTVHSDAVVAITELPGSGASVAYGVNDLGHVVGMRSTGAFFWSETDQPQFRPIGRLRDTALRCLEARGINNHDLVVGTCVDTTAAPGSTGGGAVSRAFSWAPRGALVLYEGTHRSTQGSRAFAVNEEGAIAGDAELPAVNGAPAAQEAFQWNAGTLRVGALPASAGVLAKATSYGINANGDQVGESNGQAFLALRGKAPVAIGVRGTARGINRARTIVGETADRRAFVEPADGPVEDLNALLPEKSGWTLEVAQAINDLGWIVGVGSKDGAPRGFVLIPE